MSDYAVKVSNVTKRFKLYHNPISGPLLELLTFWNRRQYYREFLAVRDVSFDIRRGEVVGIIGPNGAGKTTLLKMIAGLLPVDEGKIDVRGRVTALLALGVGVHPEFTGRENILYGGMLLGMSRREVLHKMPSIIEFAELGDFIERPFRTYSSGMRARLLFSISMSIDPEILIVDEALATGDIYFLSKSTQRIREICRSGATILFVSHSMGQVAQICERVMFMAGGQIVGDGEPTEMIAAYSRWTFERETKAVVAENSGLLRTGGSGAVVVKDIRLLDKDGQEASGFYTGQPMDIEIYCQRVDPAVEKIRLFVGFLKKPDLSIAAEIPSHRLISGGKMSDSRLTIGDKTLFRLHLDPLLLVNNSYSLFIKIADEQGGSLCEYKDVKPFFAGREGSALYRDVIFTHPAQIERITLR